ncbi:UNVERIFIED_CONTAM: hypothetical protein Slati_3654300 [Sesamum latifolium]|uniref:Uncharacterized protein n=1 Tax=Sesamum latifolium TaxID=2727402 RepID=A0AAW2U068_9LAMI
MADWEADFSREELLDKTEAFWELSLRAKGCNRDDNLATILEDAIAAGAKVEKKSLNC